MGTKAKSGDEASFPSTLSRKGGGEFGGQSPPTQGTKRAFSTNKENARIKTGGDETNY